MKPYFPFRDPLFWVCLALFLANRWVLKPNFDSLWLHSYFNDLLCLPVMVPVQVAISRTFGLRKTLAAPTAREVLVAFGLWSLIFEGLMPILQWFGKWGNGDPFDVLHYGLGGIVGLAFWKGFYRQKKLRDEK